MKQYRCKVCGTSYSTTGDTPPPSPTWDDGHVCQMIDEDELEKRMDIIGQNGNTGEHYGGEEGE